MVMIYSSLENLAMKLYRVDHLHESISIYFGTSTGMHHLSLALRWTVFLFEGASMNAKKFQKTRWRTV